MSRAVNTKSACEDRFQRFLRLDAAGVAAPDIACELGVCRKTVGTYRARNGHELDGNNVYTERCGQKTRRCCRTCKRAARARFRAGAGWPQQYFLDEGEAV